MPFTPVQVSGPNPSASTNPVDLFNGLTLRGSVNDLWPPQVEALNDWFKRREAQDISIEMNTGGGKTLVGLLVALSLGREMGKPVVLSVPTNQLVEQTRKRAGECSIDVATYYDGRWQSKDVFDRANGPCITNHHAVFNGMSIFGSLDAGAFILDDAHAAGSIVRDCFSVQIKRDHDAYSELAALYRPYFGRAALTSIFDSIVSDAANDLLFVPLFESSKQAAQARSILLSHGVSQDKNTKFAWRHIGDKLDRCTVLLDGKRMEFAPACPACEQTPLFKKGVRRIFLSATMPSPIEFSRTFGLVPSRIAPAGRLGEAQRVFLRAAGDEDDAQRCMAKQLLSHHKALVLASSDRVASDWTDVATMFESPDGQAGIDEFATASPPAKLVMASRYEGVDLPGDTCRVLVLDGLSRGQGLLSRYLNEALNVEAMRAATIAIRFIQASGRIFRSNSDHGAVIVIGKLLQAWLDMPANAAFLPPLLQQQLRLSEALNKSIEQGSNSHADILNVLLPMTREWDAFYKHEIKKCAAKPTSQPPKWLIAGAIQEREAHVRMWSGAFSEAASAYAGAAEEVQVGDSELAAWYRHFEGYCWERANLHSQASSAYRRAADKKASLGRPKVRRDDSGVSTHLSATNQAKTIEKWLSTKRGLKLEKVRRLVAELTLEASVGQVEQALKELGQALGMEASRPDKEQNVGPDVLWLSADEEQGWAFELKSGKGEQSTFTKDDVGQAHNHRQWLKDTYPSRDITLYFAGRILEVQELASPDERLRVIDLSQLQALAADVAQVYDVMADAMDDADQIASWLAHSGLKTPNCIESRQYRLAIDLQDGRDT